jgi:DNA-directed RNA polymerase specialized sigma24 family protein
VSNEGGSASASPEPGNAPVVDRDLLAQALEREAARVFEYCRALIGREDAAMSVTDAALNSARAMLQEPDQLRAWLVDLARRQARASGVSDAESARSTPPADPTTEPSPDLATLLPDSREVLELVYRHGIHREDLGAVLGVPADEASALLAVAELELGRREAPAEAAAGSADLTSAQSMLPDPDRLRAWLFALARQQALAVVSTGTAGQAAPGAELARYAGYNAVTTGPGHEFPPASWWHGSASQPMRRRRLWIAALTAIPLAAAIAVAVYLGGVSHPAGSRADTGSSTSGAGELPRSDRLNAGLVAVPPLTSPSPTVPVSVLLPVSPTPVVQPPASPPPPAPWPTPTSTPKPSTKPSPTPTPKPSTKPSPTPTPKPSTKPSPTPTPKPSTKPSPTTTPKSAATLKSAATPTPTHAPA